MHPDPDTLVAFADSACNPGRSTRIARHLQNCERCRARLAGIVEEKDKLAVLEPAGRPDPAAGLGAVLEAVARWREVQAREAEPELRVRVRTDLEMLFGAGCSAILDRPGIRGEELLSQTLALFNTFLGPEAAESVMEQIVCGLDCAGLMSEVRR